MYECFHCGCRAVVWCNDFSFEDYGEEGDGIYQVCHCTHCGAEITYRIAFDDDEDEEEPAAKPSPTECMKVLDHYMEAPWEVSTGDLHEALDVLRDFVEKADADGKNDM